MSLDQRDEHLRASLLRNAHRLGDRAPDGWISGSKLSLAARDQERQPIDSEEHTERLLNELVDLLVLVEKAAQPTGGIGNRELRHRFYRCTDMGFKLLMGNIDPIRGIATEDE